MYKLSYYTEDNEEKLLQFMQANSFAIITGISDRYPVATHVPLTIDVQQDKIICTGHIMKNTDHHRAFIKNEKCSLSLTGLIAM